MRAVAWLLSCALVVARAGALGRPRHVRRWFPAPSSNLTSFVVCGGATADGGDDLFAPEAADAPPPAAADAGADAATARFAKAAAAVRAAGGSGAAIDAFEAELAGADPSGAALAGLWLRVKLEQLARNATAPFDAASPFARGVFFLATECGAYVEGGRLDDAARAAFWGECAAALGVDAATFEREHAAFEKAMAEDVFSAARRKVEALTAALDDDGFAARAVAALRAKESKILDHLGDDDDEARERVEKVRSEMRAKLAKAAADGDKLAEASLVARLTPAVETLLGGAKLGESA